MAGEFDAYREWLGIEPHEHPVDHYRLIGVPKFEGSPEAIVAAADKQMSHLRRFQTGPRGRYTQEILNRLAAARLCLLNPAAKAAYDQRLTNEADAKAAAVPNAEIAVTHSPATFTPPPVPPPVPPPRYGSAISHEQFAVACDRSEDDEATPVSLLAGATLPIVVVLAVLLIGFGAWTIKRYKIQTSAEPSAIVEPVTVDEPPAVVEPVAESPPPIVVVQQEADGSFNFVPSVAQLHGPNLRILSDDGEDAIGNWTSREDWIEWEFRVVRPSIFRVRVTYALPASEDGGSYSLVLDEGSQTKNVATREAISSGQWVTDEFFWPIASSGRHRFALHAGPLKGKQLMLLRSIRFEAKGQSSAQ